MKITALRQTSTDRVTVTLEDESEVKSSLGAVSLRSSGAIPRVPSPGTGRWSSSPAAA